MDETCILVNCTLLLPTHSIQCLQVTYIWRCNGRRGHRLMSWGAQNQLKGVLPFVTDYISSALVTQEK